MGGMVWRSQEWWYGLVTLIEVENDPPAGFRALGFVSLALVVGEIWGELPPPQ